MRSCMLLDDTSWERCQSLWYKLHKKNIIPTKNISDMSKFVYHYITQKQDGRPARTWDKLYWKHRSCGISRQIQCHKLLVKGLTLKNMAGIWRLGAVNYEMLPFLLEQIFWDIEVEACKQGGLIINLHKIPWINCVIF